MTTTFNTLTPGTSATIIDEGVPFLDNSVYGGQVAIRQGGNVYTLTKEQAQRAGINPSSLPTATITDTGFQYARRLLGGQTLETTPDAFRSFILASPTSQTYTQTQSAVNPQGADWAVNGQILEKAMPLGTTAGYSQPGVTPQQSAAGMNVAYSMAPNAAGLAPTATQLANQVGAQQLFQKTMLPPSQAPTSTGDISGGTSQVNLPSLPSYTGNISGAIGAIAGASESDSVIAQQLKDLQAQQQEAQTTQAKNVSWIQNLLSGQNTSQQRTALESQYGAGMAEYLAQRQARVAEIDALTKEYNTYKQGMDEQVLQAQGKMATTGYINREIAAIEARYAPRLNRLSADINSKTAIMELERGNWQDAQSYINQAIQDATADKKLALDTALTFLQMNENTISRLDTKYQNALNNYVEQQRWEYEQDVRAREFAWQQRVDEAKLKLDAVKVGMEGEDPLTSADRTFLLDNYGIVAPLGTTKKRADAVLAGWTRDDMKKYERNTDGFRDIINGMLAGTIALPSGVSPTGSITKPANLMNFGSSTTPTQPVAPAGTQSTEPFAVSAFKSLTPTWYQNIWSWLGGK